ncbi:putative acyl esterase [Mycobacterium sp. MAA66]|uniref:CocE/NonD family hydrolase n=1 Tax=Mycobacterium sp. MAA66 TaxID=3156297 RepID=UPI0035181437
MTTDGDFIFVPSRPPEEGGYSGLNPSRSISEGMVFERDVAVPMRDGTLIYIDIARPDTSEPAPALIAYAPYGKHNGFPSILGKGADIAEPLPEGTPFEAPVAEYWVKHGYAVIYADPRGSWGSQGQATYFSSQEAEDGYDLVEWAGTQPWSSGKVGLTGVSYLAISQYGIAALRPPHLAAINPSEGISDQYREAIYQGGIPETQFAANLATILGFGQGQREDLLTEIFGHPYYDDFWAAKTPALENIEVPALFVCSVGNQGLHTRGTLEAYRRAGSEHKWLDVHGRKEWRYYYQRDNVERQRAFFDHFLRDAETEVSSWPPVRVEYRDRPETGPIRAESHWPPSGSDQVTLYLNAATGRLQNNAPIDPATSTYDPTASPGDPLRHAGDQTATFTYTFDEPTHLAGNCALRLFAASPGAGDMDLFVVLDKLDADGRVVTYPFCAYLDDGPLAQGWLRASRRELDSTRSTPDRPVHAHKRDLPLPDDGPVALDIEIWPFTAYLRPGESLRLTIAGADIYRWPRGEFVNGHDFTVNTAAHVLYTGADWDSSLRLPIANT